MIEFYRTRAGQRFIEVTVPRLVEELARLNANLELIVKALEQTASDTSDPDHDD